MNIKMRTLKNIELRDEGWLFEKSSEDNTIGAVKVDPGKALLHLFDGLTLAEGIVFEDIIKMLINYKELQGLNPFIKNILDEYEMVKDSEDFKYLYPIIFFEKHIIDQVESFSEDSGFFGYNPNNPELRYEIFFEKLEDLLKTPVFLSSIINTYIDEKNDVLDASMFEFYSCDIATLLKGLILNMQEMGDRDEREAEKKRYLEENKDVNLGQNNKIKLKLVKNDSNEDKKD